MNVVILVNKMIIYIQFLHLKPFMYICAIKYLGGVMAKIGISGAIIGTFWAKIRGSGVKIGDTGFKVGGSGFNIGALGP